MTQVPPAAPHLPSLFSCALLHSPKLPCNGSVGFSCDPARPTLSTNLTTLINTTTLPGSNASALFSCVLDIDVQNETSYECTRCFGEELLPNTTACAFDFKMTVDFAFETAFKNFWIDVQYLTDDISNRICDLEPWQSAVTCLTNRTSSDVLARDFGLECVWNVGVEGEGAAEYDWSFLFVILFIVAGGLGNILVCLAVCLDKRLQNVTNYFLLSLAIADLLVSLFVMPMGAIPGFLGYWPLGVAWCNVYVTCDVLACSASIMHMCFISIGRYLGIRNPLKSRHHSTKRVVIIKIALVWLLSMLVSSSITVLGLINQENIMPTSQACVINNRLFWVFGSLVAFYIPMLTMVVSFALTVQLLKRQAILASTPVPGGTQRRLCGAGGLEGAGAGEGGRSRRYGTRSSPDLSPHRLTRQLTWRVTNTRSKHREKIQGSVSQPQLNYMNGCGARAGGRVGGHAGGCAGGRARDVSTQTPLSIGAETRRAKPRALKLPLPAATPLALRFLANRKKGRSMSANAVANEQKATKVLGLVFFTFVLCWAPFFLLNILFAACPACIVPEHVVDICLWLGYVSSTINPIIYTVFNRTFRAAFLRLLRCHCDRRGRCTRYRGAAAHGASQLVARSALPLAISLRPGPGAGAGSLALPALSTPPCAAQDSSETALMADP